MIIAETLFVSIFVCNGSTVLNNYMKDADCVVGREISKRENKGGGNHFVNRAGNP